MTSQGRCDQECSQSQSSEDPNRQPHISHAYRTHKFKRSVFCCRNGCQAATLENNLPGISSAALFCFLSHAHFVLITACKVKLYMASWTNHRLTTFPIIIVFKQLVVFNLSVWDRILMMSGAVHFCLLKTLRVSSKDTRSSLVITHEMTGVPTKNKWETGGKWHFWLQKIACSVYIIVCVCNMKFTSCTDWLALPYLHHYSVCVE